MGTTIGEVSTLHPTANDFSVALHRALLNPKTELLPKNNGTQPGKKNVVSSML
jgi:hypothetical protein